MNFNLEQINTFKELVVTFLITHAPSFILAIVVFFLWLKVIKRVTAIIRKGLAKGHFEITVAKFTSNFINFTLKALLIITVAGMIWVQTTSFVAIIWAAWLAVWLALQGSLANFAWWVLILLFKPYQVWDRIELEWELGKVDEIDILLTKMTTRDSKVIIIPNGQAANEKIINRTKKWPMRIEVEIWVSYDADIDATKKVLSWVIKKSELVLNDPAPSVVVSWLWDNAVTLTMLAYSMAQNEPAIRFFFLEHAKKDLDAANISIPYPQIVVHKA